MFGAFMLPAYPRQSRRKRDEVGDLAAVACNSRRVPVVPMVRRQERFRLGGAARLWVDAHSGPVTALGRMVDLSVDGCRVLLQRRIDVNVAGRVGLDVVGTLIWIPVMTRWTQRDTDGWMVGCEFDRPTAEKQDLVRELLRELISPGGN